jgi:hypothetical protein
MSARTPARVAALALAALLVAAAPPALAAEVNGIYTEATTKDLGELTGQEWLKNWKIRGWVDGYYVYNYNQPGEDTVDDNQGSSVVKGDDISIEGRVWDVHHSKPELAMMEIELEKVPQLSGWLDPAAFGFKLDVHWGDTYEIIYDTVRAGLGRDVLNHSDKILSHYSVGYVAPIGRGLRFDVGKFVTHIGGETIEPIKNNNYSRGFLFTYAIPTFDTGLRINYPFTDTFYGEFYVLRGWNVTWDDPNSGWTIGPSVGWAPSSKVSMYASYLGGPEQRDNTSNTRHIVDVGVAVAATDKLNFLFSADYGYEENAIGSRNVNWWGAFVVARYKVLDNLEPALRVEYYDDADGFTTGLEQTLLGITLTLNYRIDLPGKTHILLRPEYRYDRSNRAFFTEGSNFRDGQDQHTLGVGAAFYF